MAAAFAGFSEEAIAAAEKVRAQVSDAGRDADARDEGHGLPAALRRLAALCLGALRQVGPDPRRPGAGAATSSTPAPSATTRAASRYLRTGRAGEAQTELAALAAIAEGSEIEGWTIAGFNSFRQVLTVAKLVLRGELEAAAGNHDAGDRHAARGDQGRGHPDLPGAAGLVPARCARSSARCCLDAGRPAEAEQVYREDLVELPGNGWSPLRPRQRARGAGQDRRSQAVRAQLDTAWKSADFALTSSRL